jgi:hypothetical protein
VALGKPFVNLPVDYALIGGVFGLVLGFVAYGSGFRFDTDRFWLVLLLTSYAHFASSTVRLYSQPGAVSRWPFLTLGVPIVTLAITSGLLFFSGRETWRAVEGFYLSWSTYHYAAQTFGLAVMYAYRSGCDLGPTERRWVRVACLLPFVYGILGPASGLSLLVPAGHWTEGAFGAARSGLRLAVLPLLLLAPALVFLHVRRARGRVLPLISLVLMYGNAAFWAFFLDRDAFAWAAIAHALQYLAIVTVFHVKDAARAPGNTHGRLYHAVGFYGVSLALAYGLFELWPRFYGVFWINLDRPSTGRHIIWIINIHHFLVDGYIWKLRGDRNLTVVVDRAIAAPAPLGAPVP